MMLVPILCQGVVRECKVHLVRVRSIKMLATDTQCCQLGSVKERTVTRTYLNASLLLRPCPTDLYPRSVLDFSDQRSYPVPLTRQEHTLDSKPAPSKPCKMQRKRYAALVFDDFLQPPESAYRTLIPSLVRLAVRALEPATATAPPTLREQLAVGSAEVDFGVVPAKDSMEVVFWRGGDAFRDLGGHFGARQWI